MTSVELDAVSADFARQLEAEIYRLRGALKVNADFWASAKSEADAGLIATMRELCAAALSNGSHEPRDL